MAAPMLDTYREVVTPEGVPLQLPAAGPVPRAMELVSEDMDPKVAARLKEVLLGASEDPQARDALRQFFRTTGFYEADAQTRRSLDELQRGARRVREALE